MTSAGDLRTMIRIVDYDRKVNTSGIPIASEREVFCGHCKWVNAHGSDVYLARQAKVTEPATLTLRYVKGVTTSCKVFRRQDTAPYEVISTNDIQDRHIWLELRIQRKAVSQ